MEAMWRSAPAIGFGSDPLNPHPTRGVEVVGANQRHELRREIVRSCPQVPGVYGVLDRKGELIYVGKSKSLRSRLLSYFAASNSEEKGGRIIEQARAIQWETQPSEFASLIREQQLIRRLSPRWNVQEVPRRQRPVYLCLGRPPAEYFFVAAKPPVGCRAVEGPFLGARRMARAVEALNKTFKLRDCSQKQVFRFAEQLQLFDLDYRPGCLRYELGTCLGPCAAACTRDAYDAQVNAAESFLDGFNDEPLVVVRELMEQSSDHHQYELAARCRDTLKSLEYLHRKLSILAQARRDYTFVYAVAGFDNCHTWYLIHSGEISESIAAPRTAAEFSAAKSTLARWKSTSSNRLDRGHGAYPHTLNLVASWFRKNYGELDRTFAPGQAGHKYHRMSLTA